MKKILLIADVPGWAFDVNLKDMTDYVSGYKYEHWYMENGTPGHVNEFDAVFAPHHRTWDIKTWPRIPVLGSLRSSVFDIISMEKPSPDNYALVNKHRGFHVVTKKNYNELAPMCPRVVYLTNPVHMARFSKLPQRQLYSYGCLIACWCGNTAHTTRRDKDLKGFSTIILPACSKVRIPLVFAEYTTNRLKYEEMPEFYNRATVYLCASVAEGASNSVMEAMASGQALITTDVGNHREMQESQFKHFGDTGIIIVNRNVDEFVAALKSITPERLIRMGEINRMEIAMRWSWDAWADRYRDFLEMAF